MHTTPDQPDIERRREIKRLSTVWKDGWTPGLYDAYATAVNDFTPQEIHAAVDRTFANRTIIPKPAQLRAVAEDVRRDATELREAQDARRRQSRTPHRAPEGAGCPRCREEYPFGEHAAWMSNGALAACSEHNHMWPGDIPDVDHGELVGITEATRRGWLKGDLADKVQVLAYELRIDGGKDAA